MADESQQVPTAPPPPGRAPIAGNPARKTYLKVIFAVLLALIVLRLMTSGSSKPKAIESSPGPFTAAPATYGDASAAPAPAPALAPVPESDNTLIGSWTLAKPPDGVCWETVVFTPTSLTYTDGAATKTVEQSYHTYPGYVNAFTGLDLQHYQQYNVTDSNHIVNVTGNQFAMMNCPYTRN